MAATGHLTAVIFPVLEIAKIAEIDHLMVLIFQVLVIVETVQDSIVLISQTTFRALEIVSEVHLWYLVI